MPDPARTWTRARRPARGALVLAVMTLALALVLPPAAHAGHAPSITRVIDAGTLGADEPLQDWSGKRPSLADVNGDGVPEIIAQNANDRVYVIDVTTGRALAELKPSTPGGPGLGPFNGPRAADLDGDGRVEIVNVNRDAVVSVWTVTGVETDARGRLPVELQWERRLDTYHDWPSADAGPVLADLNGDGALEIITQTEERGAFALKYDGSLHWSVDTWGGNAEAAVADVDGDGHLDVVFFTDGGAIHAVDGPTGAVLWRFEGRQEGAWPGSIPSPGPVADIDADGVVDVVACLRNVEDATVEHAPGAPGYRQHHFWLMATSAGELLWKAKPDWGNPLCSAYTIGHDVDGDGTFEIFGMDWDTIGHKPGGWARTHDPAVFAFNADGSERWHKSVGAWNAKAHVAIADWDGDGDQDVVAYDDRHLVAFDANHGGDRHAFHLDGWRVKQGPLFADLHGNGRLHAVLAVQDKSDAFLVIDLAPFTSDPAWPGWEAPARPDYAALAAARADADATDDADDEGAGPERGSQFDAPPAGDGADASAEDPPAREDDRPIPVLAPGGALAFAVALVGAALVTRRRAL